MTKPRPERFLTSEEMAEAFEAAAAPIVSIREADPKGQVVLRIPRRKLLPSK